MYDMEHHDRPNEELYLPTTDNINDDDKLFIVNEWVSTKAKEREQREYLTQWAKEKYRTEEFIDWFHDCFELEKIKEQLKSVPTRELDKALGIYRGQMYSFPKYTTRWIRKMENRLKSVVQYDHASVIRNVYQKYGQSQIEPREYGWPEIMDEVRRQRIATIIYDTRKDAHEDLMIANSLRQDYFEMVEVLASREDEDEAWDANRYDDVELAKRDELGKYPNIHMCKTETVALVAEYYAQDHDEMLRRWLDIMPERLPGYELAKSKFKRMKPRWLAREINLSAIEEEEKGKVTVRMTKTEYELFCEWRDHNHEMTWRLPAGDNMDIGSDDDVE